MAREMFHVKQSEVGLDRETFHVERRNCPKPDQDVPRETESPKESTQRPRETGATPDLDADELDTVESARGRTQTESNPAKSETRSPCESLCEIY
jgi:hypothetical protein